MLVFMLGVSSVFAADQARTIKVNGGDCDECKKHIETIVAGVSGVSSVVWNKNTKELTVVFDDALTSIDRVQMYLAQSGIDTPKYKATEEAYNTLPECCKYKRDK